MRRIAVAPLVIGMVAAYLAAPGVSASEADRAAPADPRALELYTPPRLISQLPPQYPRGEQFAGREGWVGLRFMVDTEGKPYEIAVTESTGIEAFERAAVEAVQAWRFEPAQFDGVPLDASVTRKITFQFDQPSTGARAEFVKNYKRLTTAIERGDRAAADQYLAQLEVTNLYEDAYLGLAGYFYAAAWGSRTERIAALRRAVAEEDDARYLPLEPYQAALRELLKLQLESNDMAAAYLTLQRIRKGDVSDAERQELERIAALIEALRSDERSFVHEGEFGASSSWFLWLLKSRFRIVVDSGGITEIKLRCDRGYVMFRYDPELEYRVEHKGGLCSMELIGDPGTRFRLVQS